MRDIAASITPSIASGILLLTVLDNSQELATHGPGRTLDLEYFDALFPNATFALTALLAMLGALTSSRMIASTLLHTPDTPRRTAGKATRALLGGAGMGIGLATLYALLASALLGPDAERFLPLVLLPSLPLAAITALIAITAPHLRALADQDWTSHLRFPLAPSLLASTGVLLTQAAGWGLPWLPAIPYSLWRSIGGPLGTALLGIAAALLLTDHRWTRLGLGFLLGIGGALTYSLNNADTMIIGFMACVGLWWARRTIIIAFRGAVTTLGQVGMQRPELLRISKS